MNEVRDAAVNFEAVKISMSQDRNGITLRLSLHPNECPPSLHTDWVGSRYMVAMVKLNDQEEPVVPEQEREIKKMISSAGMLCRNEDFGIFIGAEDNTEESIANTMRAKLEIQSRTDLRNNSEAREKFKKITEEFERWKKGYQQ
jgi:hypothetical protein|tara:strand:- start:3280 stop:3711 length:432 start_codon:yes stop_codon:yes gene_type:complete